MKDSKIVQFHCVDMQIILTVNSETELVNYCDAKYLPMPLENFVRLGDRGLKVSSRIVENGQVLGFVSDKKLFIASSVSMSQKSDYINQLLH